MKLRGLNVLPFANSSQIYTILRRQLRDYWTEAHQRVIAGVIRVARLQLVV